MKKAYCAPSLRTHVLLLGVFGDYGLPGGGGNVDPIPVRILDRPELHLD